MNTTTTTDGHNKKTKAKGTTLLVKAATQTAQPDEVEINQIETLTVKIVIAGKSQLIVNNFGTKGAQQMEDERARTKEEKLEIKKGGKPPITPEEIERRFQNARVLDRNGQDCIRSQWIKGALISASKYPDVGIASTKLRGAVYVEGDLLPIVYTPKAASDSDDRVTYYGTDKNPGLRPGDKRQTPGMARDVVRVGKFGAKQPDIRYRPVYDNWSVTFELTFEPKLISLASVYHLIRRAGTSIGLCEWRPEGPGGGKGGQFGRFDLAAAKGAQ